MNKRINNRIVLVDDHLLLRNALGKLINDFEGCQVTDLCSNGFELIKSVETGSNPNIIILDLNMPGMDGFETADWLHKNHPEIKILVLTMYDGDVALIRLLRMGVRGFLKKDIHPDDLKVAINSVAETGYYYSNMATGMLASFFYKNNTAEALEKSFLSEKEIDFLKLASTDLTYKEIADKLGITARSIDGYRDGLFEKLDVKSRVGLVIYGVKNGIISF